MTATTPPMTAWYVLEVDGTGLASAQAAEREKAERERERGGGAAVPAVRHRLRLAPRIARGSGQAGLHPARPRCCGGKEGAGAEPGGKQRPRVPGSPGGVSTAVGNPRPVCALVLRDCSAVTVPEGWEGTEPRS